MTAKLIVPQVNINGTSKDELIRQYADVMTALRAVQMAMQQAVPHGRDYQTMGADAGRNAREAWRERQVIVAELYAEISQFTLEIFEQGHAAASPWAANDPRHPDNCGFDGPTGAE